VFSFYISFYLSIPHQKVFSLLLSFSFTDAKLPFQSLYSIFLFLHLKSFLRNGNLNFNSKSICLSKLC
jgi:hypothetical protein